MVTAVMFSFSSDLRFSANVSWKVLSSIASFSLSFWSGSDLMLISVLKSSPSTSVVVDCTRVVVPSGVSIPKSSRVFSTASFTFALVSSSVFLGPSYVTSIIVSFAPVSS